MLMDAASMSAHMRNRCMKIRLLAPQLQNDLQHLNEIQNEGFRVQVLANPHPQSLDALKSSSPQGLSGQSAIIAVQGHLQGPPNCYARTSLSVELQGIYDHD